MSKPAYTIGPWAYDHHSGTIENDITARWLLNQTGTTKIKTPMTPEHNAICVGYETFLSRPVDYGWDVCLAMHGNPNAGSWLYIRKKIDEWEDHVNGNLHFYLRKIGIFARNRTPELYKRYSISFVGVIEGRPELCNLHAHLRVSMEKVMFLPFRKPAQFWRLAVANGDIHMRPLCRSAGSEGYIAKLAYERDFSDRLVFSRDY